MMSIHLEGMGLLGALTAYRLAATGVPFTWGDDDREVTAWRACTGACYPAGAPGSLDRRCWEAWRSKAFRRAYPVTTLSAAAYVVDGTNKTLPHRLEAPFVPVGKLRFVHGHDSVHVNAQALVLAAREEFADQRCGSCPPGAWRVVAHGHGRRLDHYLWGWTRLVQLSYPDDMLLPGVRPSLYLRRNRFQFAYCYPRPGTREWYAGSSLVRQPVGAPRELDVEKRYAAWRGWFEELTGGLVTVAEEGVFLQGWRPAPAGGLSAVEGAGNAGASLGVPVDRDARTVELPTCASNGFRHFPQIWDNLRAALLHGPGIEVPA